MPDMLPVMLLAFANDPANPLNLARERDNVRAALRDAERRGLVQVEDIMDTSLERLAEQFALHGDRLAVFHYAGHAGAAGLELRGGDANRLAYAEGLARLLGRTRVRFVFLNGCGTRPMVEALHAAGVRIVLATSVPVQDLMATEFAETFYGALGSGRTVRQSFEAANDMLVARHGAAAAVEVRTRGFRWGGGGAPDRIWGLYVDEDDPALPDARAVLDWGPCPPSQGVGVEGSIDAAAGANAVLRDRLAEALKQLGDPGLARTVQLAERDGRNPQSAVVAAVIAAFPLPIGEQLRILFIRRKPDGARLEQLLRTYAVAMQFLCYTVLAQLWDDLAAAEAAGGTLAMDAEQRAALEEFQGIDAAAAPGYSHYDLTVRVLAVLVANGNTSFLYSCATVLAALTDGASAGAHRFFAELRAGALPTGPEAVGALCREATAHVAELLCDLAFMALYKATTVRTIGVQRYRRSKARFLTRAIALDGGMLSSELREWTYDDAIDDRSVVLQRDRELGDGTAPLNLTPWVVDESAFSDGVLPNLYFFSHRATDAEETRFVYRMICDPRNELVVPDPDGRWPRLEPLRGMFAAFDRLVAP